MLAEGAPTVDNRDGAPASVTTTSSFFLRSYQRSLRAQLVHFIFELFDPLLKFRDGLPGFLQRVLGIFPRAFDLIRDFLNRFARLLDTLLLVPHSAPETLQILFDRRNIDRWIPRGDLSRRRGARW